VSDESDAVRLVGLLADDDRLRVVASLALGARTRAEVADHTGLGTRKLTTALHRLVVGELVEEDDGRYRLCRERLATAARARPAGGTDPGLDVDVDKAVRPFFKGGRLTSIPAARAKRLAVLDILAGRFEPGRVYPERNVNAILREYNEDVAALRRYLIDEEFLERREGFYWRAGGTFEV